MKNESLLLAGVVALGLGALWVAQWRLIQQPELDELAVLSRKAQHELIELRVTLSKLPEFMARMTEVEMRLAEARRAVPVSLDGQELVKALQASAQRARLQLGQPSVTTQTAQGVVTVEIHATVAGAPAARSAWFRRIADGDAGPSLAVLGADGAAVRLRAHALPVPAPATPPDPCAASARAASGSWPGLWPYDDDVRRLRQGLAVACHERELLAVVRVKVQQFRDEQAELERRRALIPAP